MSKAKTKIESVVVQDFLENNYDKKVSSVVSLKSGEISQAFSFSSKGKSLVLRVTTNEDNGFAKDEYAYENFSEYGIPIPKILDIGTFDEYFFAISERVEGKIPNHFNRKEITKLMPDIVKVLGLIHSVNVSNKKGFGSWNTEGVGKDKSWKDVLLRYFQEVDESWEKKYENTIFEKEIFDQTRENLQGIVDSLSGVHFLVHADYGFDNLLFKGSKITGVIDWEHSAYGDFLYDVAWLEFWAPNVGFAKIFKDYYQKSEIDITNWDNRILSCICYLGAGALGFFATFEQRKKYDWARKRLLYFLE